MGCICSKGISTDEDGETQQKDLSKSLKRFVTLSKKDEVVAAVVEVVVGNDGGSTRPRPKPQDNGVSAALRMPDEEEKKAMVNVDRTRKAVQHQRRATVGAGANGSSTFGGDEAEPNLVIVDVPNGFSGEHEAAGWPSWLTSVAGEAVKGWLPRRVNSFEKLDKIGQGTYSHVYRAHDLETGKIVALKKVRFVNMDPESVRFMAREIHILRRLDHPNVIKLEGIVTSTMSCNLYLVFEYMEHDLAGLAATPGIKFTEPQVKCYMQQLLRGLDHCHSRGVLHRDIKGSNLLIDNNGILKIGDFGLATIFNTEKKQQLTSRVVTLWYRPPELLLGATEYDVAIDLWSAGCILAELLAGKPIMPGRTEVEQLHKIFKLCGSPSDEYWKKSKLPHATIFKPQNRYRRCFAETFKDFPPSALALLDSLLAIEPEKRGTAASALDSEVEQLHKIFKLCGSPSDEYWKKSKLPHATIFKPQNRYRRCFAETFKDFPPSALALLDSLLAIEPEKRGTAASALDSEFFRSMPLACDPSSLPKYPPTKEYDAKLRDEEARRQKAAANNSRGSESVRPGRGESRGMQVPLEQQNRQSQANPKSTSEKYSPLEDGAEGFPIDPPLRAENGFPQSGQPGAYGNLWPKNVNKDVRSYSSMRVPNGPQLRTQRSYRPQSGADFSTFPASVAAKGSSNSRYNPLDVTEPSEKQMLDRPSSAYKKDYGVGGKDSTAIGYGSKNKRIHYSGPLVPPGGNIEDMLKEHERQIQQAVRKARLDKVKTKKNF
ncbi:putative serine/threonine-protein kinase [Cocos nucifera]|uniref:[RNA-polymerase]-subunit kinase n=1 Tax=Cocos nucifera TaxID=13894 RepID=A0A8K0MX92_COCNU|nr:putative serine/threonine-protein kinase [Cocos nucifera]